MGLPQWERRAVDAMSDATPVRRRPVWQLVKELRLQQMTVIVGALYLPWWGAMAVLWRFAPEAVTSLAGAVAILYGPLLALLSGSLASAEERQLGTMEWQMLLPLPMWKQWAVKTATVAGLALVLGVGPAGPSDVDQTAARRHAHQRHGRVSSRPGSPPLACMSLSLSYQRRSLPRCCRCRSGARWSSSLRSWPKAWDGRAASCTQRHQSVARRPADRPSRAVPNAAQRADVAQARSTAHSSWQSHSSRSCCGSGSRTTDWASVRPDGSGIRRCGWRAAS